MKTVGTSLPPSKAVKLQEILVALHIDCPPKSSVLKAGPLSLMLPRKALVGGVEPLDKRQDLVRGFRS